MPEMPNDAGRFLFANGVCAIGDTLFTCSCVKQHHAINQIPIAEITVTSDEAMDYKGVYKALLAKKQGDKVIVSFDFTSDPVTLTSGKKSKALFNQLTTVFYGVLLGWAPVWIGPKSFRMVIWAMHPLGLLDWASLPITPVHGAGLDDHQVPVISGTGQELIPYMPGPYKESDASKDLWKNVIKKELIRICNSTWDGLPNSKPLVEYLEDAEGRNVDGSESPLSLTVVKPNRAILDVRKTLCMSASGRKSLWDALVILADTYKFSILCRSLDFSIAPTLAALGSRNDGVDALPVLHTWKFVPRAEYNALDRSITESLSLIRGMGVAPSFFDAVSKRRQDEFRSQPDATFTCGIEYRDTPAFMDFLYDPFFYTVKTMGLGTDQLFASGYRLVDPEGESELATLNKAYNAIPETEVDGYADVLHNEVSYSQVTAVYRGNIDFNISPGSQVLLDPPRYYRQPSEPADFMYQARVWSVTNVLDMGSKTSGTYVILSHVRTSEQQGKIELDRHPLYNHRWVSAPLLSIKGFTETAIHD